MYVAAHQACIKGVWCFIVVRACVIVSSCPCTSAHRSRFIRTRNFKRSASFPSGAASGAGFHTFTLSCTLEQLATVVGIPGLLAIEQDAIVSLNGTLEAMGGSARRLDVTNGTFQLRAVPGLDRIDQAVGPLNGVYKYAYDGAGVRVYVVDTGVRTTHTEFGGRAVKGIDLVNVGGSATDCNGHGTHVRNQPRVN